MIFFYKPCNFHKNIEDRRIWNFVRGFAAIENTLLGCWFFTESSEKQELRYFWKLETSVWKDNRQENYQKKILEASVFSLSLEFCGTLLNSFNLYLFYTTIITLFIFNLTHIFFLHVVAAFLGSGWFFTDRRSPSDSSFFLNFFFLLSHIFQLSLFH